MAEHPFKEGERVVTERNNCGQVEMHEGVVVQTSSTQPHITWVRFDDESGWKMIGTAHLRHAPAAMSEAEIERAIDRRVMRRLETDRAYRNAENAEEQAQREEEITRQVEREFGVEEV